VEDDMNTIKNKIKENRQNIVTALMGGVILLLYLVFQEWMNAYDEIIITVAFVGVILLFGEEFINFAGAMMLYMAILLGLTSAALLLGFSPIIVVATLVAASMCASILITTMPQGSILEMFFHRRKLIVRLESY